MLLIREVMFCKPGKVRALVEKFLQMSAIGERMGMPPMKVMTDFSAERYWTVVGEMEVDSLQAFEKMMSMGPGSGYNEKDAKEMENSMKGFFFFNDTATTEIYKLEG